MEKWIYLMIGGLTGTAARYGLTGLVSQKAGAGFPWGTIAVNIAGCFLVGFLDVFLGKKFSLSPQYRLLLMTGFCGAFTTFSALMLETSQLLKSGGFLSAAGNVMISVGLGFAVLWLGAAIADFI